MVKGQKSAAAKFIALSCGSALLSSLPWSTHRLFVWDGVMKAVLCDVMRILPRNKMLLCNTIRMTTAGNV